MLPWTTTALTETRVAIVLCSFLLDGYDQFSKVMMSIIIQFEKKEIYKYIVFISLNTFL